MVKNASGISLNLYRLAWSVAYVTASPKLREGKSTKSGRFYRFVKLKVRDACDNKHFFTVSMSGLLGEWAMKELTGRINQMVLILGHWKKVEFYSHKSKTLTVSHDFVAYQIAKVGNNLKTIAENGGVPSEPDEFITMTYAAPDASVELEPGVLPWAPLDDGEESDFQFEEGKSEP